MLVCSVTWVDKDGDGLYHLPEEFILGDDLAKCMGIIGRRCHQSPQLIPQGAYGFRLVPVPTGIPSEEEKLDDFISKMNDE